MNKSPVFSLRSSVFCLLIAALSLLLFSSCTFAVTLIEPNDANREVGTWIIPVGEDINQPVWACGTRYEGNLIQMTVTGLPAGLTFTQSAADMNLPASEYPDANDPQYDDIINPQVGKGYIRGRLNKPIADATVLVMSFGHIETLTIKSSEREHGITHGKKK